MNPTRVRFAGRTSAAALLLVLAGCGSNWNPPAIGPERGARIISVGEIQLSGATNAWEVLERTGFYMPSSPGTLVPESQTRREHANAPKVMVDGVPMLDIRLLRDIPAQAILSVRMVSTIILIQTHR